MLKINAARKSRFTASAAAGLFSAAQLFSLALYPILAERLRLSISTIIATFSFGSALFFFGSPYWSSRSDRENRFRTLRWGVSALFVSFAGVYFLLHFPIAHAGATFAGLLATRIVYGFFASGVLPIAQAIQAENSARLRPMMLHSLSQNLGRVGAAGFLVYFPQNFEFFLGSVLAGCGVVILIADGQGSALPLIPTEKAFSAARDSRSGWKSLLSGNSSLPILLTTAFLFACFMETLNASLGGTLRLILGLDAISATRATARVLLFASLGLFIFQAVGSTLRKLSWSVGVSIGLASLTIGSWLLLHARNAQEIWTALAVTVIGVAWLPPFYLSGLRADAGDYGRRAGMISAVHTLGYAMGGGISALVLHSGGTVATVLLGLSVFLGIAFFRLAKWRASAPSPLSEIR